MTLARVRAGELGEQVVEAVSRAQREAASTTDELTLGDWGFLYYLGEVFSRARDAAAELTRFRRGGCRASTVPASP